MLQVREEELDAMMAHLGGQKVEVPELLFAPECVEMELRRVDAIAALATEEGRRRSQRRLRSMAQQDVTAHPDGLTMLVGVGSGKTSLLSAIMGRSPSSEGRWKWGLGGLHRAERLHRTTLSKVSCSARRG